MRKIIQFCALPLVAAGVVVQTASAVNITIDDKMAGGNNFPSGPSRIGQGGEDQETEPGTVANQSWDLEAFTLNGTKLSVYSGFNLLGGNDPYALGDIFIDIDGNAKWGESSSATGNGTYKYDYVIAFSERNGQSIGTGAYKVYSLNEADTVQFAGVGISANDESNPFRYRSGGTEVGSGTMMVTTPGSADITLEDGTKVTGGTHYVGEVDVGFLNTLEGVLFHTTLGCGNDNLIGRVPDGGSALSLFGMALSGLSFAGWRFGRRS
jgi:hypothetical protein